MSESISKFNWIDLVFVILFLGMIYKGLKAGVGGQNLSLVGWFVLLFIPIKYYSLISETVLGFVTQEWAKPISFFVISVTIFIIIMVIEKAVHAAGEQEFALIEKIGGIIVGGFRAAVLCGLIGMLFLLIPTSYMHKSVTETSMSCMFFVKFDAGIYSWMTGALGKENKVARDTVVEGFLTSGEKG